MNPPGLKNHTLMLAETESEKTKWVVALNELHRILKRNNLPTRTVYRAKELVDNTVTVTKSACCGAIVDPDRLVIGTDDGLFCVDLDRDGNFFQKTRTMSANCHSFIKNKELIISSNSYRVDF